MLQRPATASADLAIVASGRGRSLVGRDRELRTLREALETARSGRGRLVIVAGDAGIGKTRLADALAREASAAGTAVAWGRSWETGGAPAYWPWRQAIQALLATADRPIADAAMSAAGPALDRILPALGDEPGSPPDPTPDSRDARPMAFEAAARLLDGLAADRTLLLVLDDLHAADEPSLLLLRSLATRITDQRILILAAHRREELEADDHRLRILAGLAREPGVVTITPRPLSEADVSAYIAAEVEATPPLELVREVHRRTEGNPLFVGELVRWLVSRRDPGADVLWALPALHVPEGIAAVIEERLERLSPPCRSLLDRGSVIGMEITLASLAFVDEGAVGSTLDLLDEATVARVLQPPATPGGSWRFAHALLRDVLYARLPTAMRTALHLRIATALEAGSGAGTEPVADSERPLTELAHHFLHALPTGDRSKAVAYARLAADRASAILAHEEAVRLLGLALGIDGLPSRLRKELLLAQGEAASRAGDQASMRRAFLAAAELAEGEGNGEDLARAALGYGGRLVHRRAGDDVRLVPLLGRALALLSPDDSELRARLLARLAGALRDEPRPERRDALSAEAVAMARRLADPSTLSYALQARHSAIWGPDALDEMRATLDEVTAIAIAAGDRERVAETHWHRLVMLLTMAADAEAMDAELEAGLREARDLRQPALEWYGAQWRIVAAIDEARLDDAEALLLELRRSGDGPLPWDADYACRMGSFLLRREQGRLAEVADEVHAAVEAFPGYRLLACFAAYVDAVTGREAAAREALAEIARDDLSFLPRDLGWCFGAMFIGETALELGDSHVAGAVARALEPYAGQFATASGAMPGGPVARVLGRLLAASGAYDEALGHLAGAAAISARMRARLWEVRTQLDRAAVLGQRDGPGDREAALALVTGVQAAADALGLVAIGREAARLEATLSSRGGREPVEPRDLTDRRPVFRREGEYWTIAWAVTFRLRDSKGLRCLAVLLDRPGREIHALELQAVAAGTTDRAQRRDLPPDLGVTTAHGDPVIDDAARRAYRERLLELRAERDEADDANDPVRAERARAEIEALETELVAAFGLGGRRRESASPAERARQSVTKAIRDTLARIEAQDRELGGHLRRSIHTGLYCSYDPDPSALPRWETA